MIAIHRASDNALLGITADACAAICMREALGIATTTEIVAPASVRQVFREARESQRTIRHEKMRRRWDRGANR